MFRHNNGLRCKQVEALLSVYIEGDLPPTQESMVRAHLDACPSCRVMVGRARELIDQLQKEATGRRRRLSPAAAARVRNGVYSRIKRRMFMQRTAQFGSRVAALVALALIVGLFAVWQLAPPQKDREIAPGVDGRDESTVITFAGQKYYRQAYEALMAEFHEQYPNIEVQFVPLEEIQGDEGYNLQKIAASADTATLSAPPQGNEATFFYDLAPLIEADASFDTADFWPNLLTGCRVGERTIGLPLALNVNLIFFDGAAFDAAGLPRPAPGWTWDDFQRAVQSLTLREGDQVVRYGFVPSFPGNPLGLLWPLVEATWTHTGDRLDSARLAEALGWYVDLARQGAIPVFGEDEPSWQQGQTLIDNGQAAMWIDFSGNLAGKRNVLGSEINVAPFPISSSATNTTPALPFCGVISAGSQQPQAAWLWLKFLTYHPIDDRLPMRPSVAEASGYWDHLSLETEETLRFALEHARYAYSHLEFVPFISQALDQALAGEADLTSALAQIDEVPPAPDPAPDDSPTPVPVATPEPTIVPGSVITVNYYSFGMAHATDALADEFNRTHPGIEIRPSTMLQNVTRFNITDVAEQYDCFSWFGGDQQRALTQLYSLEPFLATEEPPLTEDFDPAALDAFRVDGELYGLPLESRPTVIYYNADYLAEMGLSPPDLDWTVDDFWTLVAQATSGEGANKVYGFVPFQGAYLDFLLASQGVSLYDGSTQPPEIRLDDPALASAVTWIVDLAASGVMPAYEAEFGLQRENYSERETLILSGRAALWTDNANGQDISVADLPPDFEVGVAPLPFTPVPVSDPSLNLGLYISRRAQDPSACWAWIEFLSRQPTAFNGLPARRSVIESEAWVATVGADLAAVYRAASSRIEGTWQPEQRNNLAPVERWWMQALDAAFQGVDPAEALAEAQNKADAYLACLDLTEKPDAAQRNACAKEADPDYKTIEELLQEKP